MCQVYSVTALVGGLLIRIVLVFAPGFRLNGILESLIPYSSTRCKALQPVGAGSWEAGRLQMLHA